MRSRRLINQVFEEAEQGSIFFNLSRGDHGKALLGAGLYCNEPEFAKACAEYVNMLKIMRMNSGVTFNEDPVAVVDQIVASHQGIVVTKIDHHDRARYQVLSRRKKTGLTDEMLTALEARFPSLASDDVVLWKMRVSSPGELTYAGITFYGESDIASRSPLYDPELKRRRRQHRLGQSKKFGQFGGPPTP